jgi:hypothetical protein
MTEKEGFVALKASDIQPGKCFRAKRPKVVFPDLIDDRQIAWASGDLSLVQYDSPTVGIGRQLPIVGMDRFLKWAGKEVVLPNGEWAKKEEVSS